MESLPIFIKRKKYAKLTMNMNIIKQWLAQRCCGVSILGDIQKTFGDGPGQPALGGSA